MRYFLVFIPFIILGCAQMSALTGGVSDEFAPEIDSLKTYPHNGQLNFNGDIIEIKFKEYITLKNPNDNIIITPQQKERPLITSHNKKLSIEFNEELEANTTYTISFNHAVQDITEKNDSIFQFVFSTGDYIDSLSIQGKAIDAFTNTPEKDFLVALYPVSTEAFFDSIPLISKPTYIGQTDANGNFNLNYLKGGLYYLFVFEDKNRNLLLDYDEKLGFLDNQTVLVDSEVDFLNIKTFHEESMIDPKILSTRFLYPGKFEMIFSSSAEEGGFNLKTSMGLLKEDTGFDDSLVFWLESNPTSKMRFYTTFYEEADTLKPLYKGVPEFGKEPELGLKHKIVKGYLLPGENFQLEIAEPIFSLDENLIHFYDIDSQEVKVDHVILNNRIIEFETENTLASRVIIDSASIHTIYGNQNESALDLLFENKDSSYFGSVQINIDTTFVKPVYVELLNASGDVIRQSSFDQVLLFTDLIPGNYQMRLVFDENNDFEWTTGSLLDKRQPENVIYFKGELIIKSRWEKEIDWELKMVNNGNV